MALGYDTALSLVYEPKRMVQRSSWSVGYELCGPKRIVG